MASGITVSSLVLKVVEVIFSRSLTSNLVRIGETRVLIQKDSPAGRAMGLITDSVIMADNLATVHEREIDKIIGYFPRMADVDAGLRKVLRL
jgi:mRNA interferase MazF